MLFLNQYWFTKKEMFHYIHSQGLRVDDSFLEALQKQGLMLPPSDRKGKGRGKGNPGLWSGHQVELLKSLCHLRDQRKLHSVAARCNLPVWVWLYWGEDYGITLEQVRHVMITWAKRVQSLSHESAQRSAHHLVDLVANHDTGGRRQAQQELTEQLYDGEDDADALYGSLARAFDPIRPANGPQELPVVPHLIVDMIRARRVAIKALVNHQHLPDMHWLWARHSHLWALQGYLRDLPGYAREVAGTPVASLFSEETLETLFPRTCVDLASVLGVGLLYPEMSHLPFHLRLEFWQRSVRAARVQAKIVVSPLIVPNSARPTSLEIHETIESAESPES